MIIYSDPPHRVQSRAARTQQARAHVPHRRLAKFHTGVNINHVRVFERVSTLRHNVCQRILASFQQGLRWIRWFGYSGWCWLGVAWFGFGFVWFGSVVGVFWFVAGSVWPVWGLR